VRSSTAIPSPQGFDPALRGVCEKSARSVVHMDPEALTSLKGRGDGYLRDRTSNRARRIQVKPLSSDS
jgi:hypothetical protein